MNFAEAFLAMKSGKWVFCVHHNKTQYSIVNGVFTLRVPVAIPLSKLMTYREHALQPSDPCTLFVKDLLDEEWEIVP